MLYNETGQPQKALADFSKAIELDPSDSYPYEQRAAIYRNHLNDSRRADADDRAAADLRNQNREKLRQRAKANRDKKKA